MNHAHTLQPSLRSSAMPAPRFKPAALAALLAMGMFSSAQAQSLVDLYKTAQQNDTTLQAAAGPVRCRAGQRRAGQSRVASRRRAWPQAPTGPTSIPAWHPGLRRSTTRILASVASQPLYRPVNGYTEEQGQLGIDIARAQLTAAEQDLIVRTAQAYFDVVAARDTLSVRASPEEGGGRTARIGQANFEVGTTTVTDSREAQARYDLVGAQEIAASNDLARQEAGAGPVGGQNRCRSQTPGQPSEPARGAARQRRGMGRFAACGNTRWCASSTRNSISLKSKS